MTQPDADDARLTRRQLYSIATRQALLDVATDLFTTQGYASTSLDAIVSGANVTKGALYHHFTNKQAVFSAVVTRIEESAAARINEATTHATDPWAKAHAGLRAFLEVVQEPSYRQVIIADGPSVLGSRLVEQEERSTYANVHDIVKAVMQAGSWEIEEEMLEVFTRIFFGAMSSAGSGVATSADAKLAAERVEAAIGFILAGIKALVDAGVELPETGPDQIPT